MYSEEQYHKALALYDKCGFVIKTITQFGYPVRRQLDYAPKTSFVWLFHFSRHQYSGASKVSRTGTESIDSIRRGFELGEDAQLALKKNGIHLSERVIHRLMNQEHL